MHRGSSSHEEDHNSNHRAPPTAAAEEEMSGSDNHSSGAPASSATTTRPNYVLPRHASTGSLASTTTTSTSTSRPRTTTKRLLPLIRRVTSKEDVLSVSLPGTLRQGSTNSQEEDVLSASHPGFSTYPRRSSSTDVQNIVVPTLFVPLKSCLSHNQLDTMMRSHGNMRNSSTNNNNNNNHTTTLMKKSVSFHNIEIREHCRTLGDSPSVSNGPALAIGWESSDLGSLSLDDYERFRPPRRTKTELAVPRHVRETILRKEAGISRGDMAAATRERIRYQARRNRQCAAAVQPLRGVFKKLLGSGGSSSVTDATTERQVDELMELSRRVDYEREQQRQAYMAQLMQELSVQQQQQQQGEAEQQVPGQSTWEEEKKNTTTTPQTSFSTSTQDEDESSANVVVVPKKLDRKPSFLPDQDHADSGDEQAVYHIEF